MSERSYRHVDDLSPVAEPAPMLGVPGKMPVTARLSGRQPIIFRFENGPRDGNGLAVDSEAAVDRAAATSGQPLPATLRDRFEASLGADLSAVRLHTGAPSSEAASAVGARAYAVGQDIHFAAGQYDPSSAFGVHLIAHEVAHTVQQQGASPSRQDKLEVSEPGDPLETEADQAAEAMTTGRPATIARAADSRLLLLRHPDGAAAAPAPAKDFRPIVGVPVVPPLELNREFGMQVKVDNAAAAPPGTTYDWTWIDDASMLETRPATAHTAAAELRAKPIFEGASEIGARAGARVPFIPGATLAPVDGLAMLARATVPAPEVTWGCKVTPRNKNGRQRDVGATPMKIYRTDLVDLSAEFDKVFKPSDLGVQLEISASGAGNTMAMPSVRWDGNKATLPIEANRAGAFSVTARTRIPGALAGELSNQWDFKVVMDLDDVERMCNATHLCISTKWHQASQKLDDAANAFTAAKTAHDAVLAASAAEDKLVQDLLLGAFLAGLGGAAGGAVGAMLKERLNTHDATTDTFKDVTKFAVRTLQQLQPGGGVTPAPKAPSNATPKGAADSGQDPAVWARGISSKLHAEAGDALAMLLKVTEVIMNPNTDRDADLDGLEGNPFEQANSDMTIQAIMGISTNEQDYKRALWQSWLSNFAYKVQFFPPRDSNIGSFGPVAFSKSMVTDPIRKAILEGAKQCGEDGNAWIAQYAPHAEAKADKEVDRYNHPHPEGEAPE